MKIVLFAAAAMLAGPAIAQMTPQTTTGQAAPQSAPMPDQTAPTAPPTMTPDATAATPPAAATTDPMTTGSAAPMPMAGGKLPMCRAGQYTGCKERENKRGEGLRKN